MEERINIPDQRGMPLLGSREKRALRRNIEHIRRLIASEVMPRAVSRDRCHYFGGEILRPMKSGYNLGFSGGLGRCFNITTVVV